MVLCSTYIQPNESLSKPVFADQLRRLAKLRDLPAGKKLHARIVEAGHGNDGLLCNLLVNMYAKCGSLDEARTLFDRTQNKNVFSWNIMLSAYQSNACEREAVHLFHEMDLDGVHPDNVTYVTLLTACSSRGYAAQGKELHTRIITTGYFNVHVSVGSALVKMYGCLRSIREAENVFKIMPRRNLVTWNTLLGVYAKNGSEKEALQLYRGMKQANVEMDYVTYVVALGACKTLEEGKQVHADTASLKSDVSVTLENALIGFYARCKAVDTARSVFDNMKARKDTVSWNSMISAYVLSGDSTQALQIYRMMGSTSPDKATFLSVLGACSSPAHLPDGRSIHAKIKAAGFNKHASVCNALIYMYGRCGSPVDAKLVFDTMQERDIISWNVLINAYVQNGDAKSALSLYCRLEEDECSPNAITFVSILGACGDLKQGENVHRRVESTVFKSDVVVATALVSMYGRLGSMSRARDVFDGMKAKSVVPWNAFLTACCQCGEESQALNLFQRCMDVKPNDVTYIILVEACASLNKLEKGRELHRRATSAGLLPGSCQLANALIRMYGKCKSVESAAGLFNSMPAKTLVSWNSMIAAYVENGENRQGLELFKQMELKPDHITYMSVLMACSGIGDLTEGRAVHDRIKGTDIELMESVGTSLVTMYGNCGSLEDAGEVFGRMQRRDATSWTSMMVAYAQNGHASTATELFYVMNLEGVELDGITFSVLFFCCSHSGLLERGWEYFMYMVGDFGVEATVKHYACIVDLVSRLGWVEEAEKVAEGMPYKADPVVWLTLLSACNVQMNAVRGANAAERLIEMNDAGASSAYALLCGIYSTPVTGLV